MKSIIKNLLLLTFLALLPFQGNAAIYKGTITIEVGENYSVDVGFSYSTVSGYWTKSNSTFGFRSQGQRSCTIYGINEGTGTLRWKGVVNADDFEYYWDVVVEEPDNEIHDWDYFITDDNFLYQVTDWTKKTCRIGWNSVEKPESGTYSYGDQANREGKIVIPNKVSGQTNSGKKVNGFTVTEVAPYAFYSRKLSEIVLPNTITTIGRQAFRGCSNLTSIAIPNSVICIGDDAFRDCSGLTSVTFPNSVTSIGEFAFYGCSNLMTVTAPSNILFVGQYAFYDTPWLKNKPEGVVYIGQAAYTYRGKFSSGATLTIKDGTKSISPYFINYETSSGAEMVRTIEIPSSVMSIGHDAFNGCFQADVFSDIVSPFDIPTNAFSVALSSVRRYVLYVPDGSKQLYLALDGWNKFDIVEKSIATAMKARKVCNIDKATFPDDNFRSRLLTREDGSDAILTEWELWRFVYLLATEKHISDMKGIEYLTSLKGLNVYNNDLISLDLSKNMELTSVWCARNNISGKNMDNLINSLPINDTDTDFNLYVYNNTCWMN